MKRRGLNRYFDMPYVLMHLAYGAGWILAGYGAAHFFFSRAG